MENTLKSVEMKPFDYQPPIELFKALAAFQHECPIIYKKTKGYGYNYADLPTIIETITPLLKKNGLGFTQLIQGTTIQTFVFHCETGQHIESQTEIIQSDFKGMNTLQSFGSALSYFRRYSLTAILGIVSDSDMDGAGQPKRMASKDEPTKKPLNQKQFVRAMSEIQSGKYSKDEIIDSFELTDEQRLAIDEMNV